MIKLIVVLIATGLCAHGSPSCADWQYTKWGMTPEQVIAASGGKAKRPGPAFVASHKDVSPVSGAFVLPSGEKAVVNFDFVENRLASVTLLAFERYGTDLPLLLRQTYGAPIYRETSPGALSSETTEWRSEKHNQHVQLYELRQDPNYTARSITYRPTFEPNQGGL
jgi:hypothetical protein